MIVFGVFRIDELNYRSNVRIQMCVIERYGVLEHVHCNAENSSRTTNLNRTMNQIETYG